MMAKKRHSVERLPTLSAFDEERIVWLKNLEDNIQLDEERRRRSNLRRQQAEDSSSTTSSTPRPHRLPRCHQHLLVFLEQHHLL